MARVASLSGSESWTKVGVMMRQSLDAGSAQAMMLVSKSKGAAFQRRTADADADVRVLGIAAELAPVGAPLYEEIGKAS